MFRKISSAAADTHSFSSLASPFAARPPKPTPLYSRNSTSLIPNAESSQGEPKIGVSTARLRNFLQTNCKSGDVTADEALVFFHRMVETEPGRPLYSFNLLLNGLAKNKRYYDVHSLFRQMISVGLTPNFITLYILLKSSCNANRVGDAFLVMGRILRKGYSPTMVTFNSLIKGLCMAGRVDDAVQLCLTLEKFGCRPDDITWRALSRGLRLYGLGNTSNAFKFHEEEVIGNDQYGARSHLPNEVINTIVSLCKKGEEDVAMKLLLEMQEWGFSPDIRFYNSLTNGLCCVGEWKTAQNLLIEIADQDLHFDGKTFYVWMDTFCQGGCLGGVKRVLDGMIQLGIDLKST